MNSVSVPVYEAPFLNPIAQPPVIHKQHLYVFKQLGVMLFYYKQVVAALFD
jgi:hypothetical protein